MKKPSNQTGMSPAGKTSDTGSTGSSAKSGESGCRYHEKSNCCLQNSEFDFCSCQALLMYCILTVSGFVTAVKRKGTESILGSAGGEATKTMKGSTGESKKVQC